MAERRFDDGFVFGPATAALQIEARGCAKRFGIIAVDYPTQRRTVKASGWEYANIIAWRTLDHAAVGAARG